MSIFKLSSMMCAGSVCAGDLTYILLAGGCQLIHMILHTFIAERCLLVCVISPVLKTVGWYLL